jgi:uncharacterized protein YkwD
MPETEQNHRLVGRRAASRGLLSVTALMLGGAVFPAGLALAEDLSPPGATPTAEVTPLATPAFDAVATATAMAYAATPAAATATAAAAPQATATPAPTAVPLPEPQGDISSLEMLALSLVNGARASAGPPVLEWNQSMAGAARSHAQDMMQHNRVSHSGSDGSTPQQRLRQFGVEFRFGSENIWTYWGKVPEEGPRVMHAAMMAEPHAPGLWNHIGNILYTGYRRIGIGIVTNANGVQYMSEKFAD